MSCYKKEKSIGRKTETLLMKSLVVRAEGVIHINIKRNTIKLKNILTI